VPLRSLRIAGSVNDKDVVAGCNRKCLVRLLRGKVPANGQASERAAPVERGRHCAPREEASEEYTCEQTDLRRIHGRHTAAARQLHSGYVPDKRVTHRKEYEGKGAAQHVERKCNRHVRALGICIESRGRVAGCYGRFWVG